MPGLSQQTSEDQIQELKEAFSLFDKKGKGTIEQEVLCDLLRAIGQNPTLSQIKDILASIPDQSKPINFETFLDIVNRPDGYKPPGSLDEFVQGFQVFDKDANGYISAGELRYVLTSLGEKMSGLEVDEIIKGMDIDNDGLIPYEEFVKTILAA